MRIKKPRQIRQWLPVIDLLPAFRHWTLDRSAPLCLEWYGHWNEVGHLLAATGVTKGLLAAGIVRYQRYQWRRIG
jgi:hypothetical protein